MREMAVECLFMGRHKKFPDRKTVTFPEGSLQRFESVAREGEDVMDIIRDASLAEVDRREREAAAIEAEVERRIDEWLRERKANNPV